MILEGSTIATSTADAGVGAASAFRQPGAACAAPVSPMPILSNREVASVLMRLAADLTQAEHPAVAAMIRYALVEIDDRTV